MHLTPRPLIRRKNTETQGVAGVVVDCVDAEMTESGVGTCRPRRYNDNRVRNGRKSREGKTRTGCQICDFINLKQTS